MSIRSLNLGGGTQNTTMSELFESDSNEKSDASST